MKTFVKNALVWGLVICVMAIAGCIDEKKEITLNPDGSGKMVYETVFKPSVMKVGGKEQEPKTESDHIAGVIKSSAGIDIWEDVSCKKLDDGMMRFAGTAYFRSLKFSQRDRIYHTSRQTRRSGRSDPGRA